MIPKLKPWPYSPKDLLGRGGYAKVYKSEDGGHAVKVFDDPHYVNTFEKEIAALKLLESCPGTLRLVDHGRDAQGRLCIVTALVPGIRLDQHIEATGGLSPAETETLLQQMLDVLACAHRHGLLHKDVNASNILMDGDTFTLIDWGVAEMRGDGRHEAIRAKPEVVAPECYYGRQDVATDFYALGWLAVMALGGGQPYHFAEIADPHYRVAAHCLERPRVDAAIPPPLRRLILCWLDKDPAKRPVSYRLSEQLAMASEMAVPDFLESLDFRQLQREFSYLHLAARHDVPYAQHRFGLQLWEQGLRREADYWLERARRNGYVEATYSLAKVSAKSDADRAGRLMQEAAQAGHAGAQFRLGRTLLRESPARADIAEQWLRSAAEKGHARGQHRLGLLLQNSARSVEAKQWIAKAAERGWPEPEPQPAQLSTGDALAGLQRLALDDQPRYYAALAAEKRMAFQHYFPFLYLYSQAGAGRDEFLIGEEAGSVCVFRRKRTEEDAMLMLAFLPLPMNTIALQRCLERVREHNRSREAQVCWVDEADLRKLDAAGAWWAISEKEEYIYSQTVLASLDGLEKKNLRQNINRIVRREDVELRDYQPGDMAACLALHQEWFDQQQEKYGTFRGVGYTRLCIELADRFHHNALLGKVVLIDGRIRSFGFSGQIRPGLGNEFIAYSDHTIKGLHHYLQYHLIQSIPDAELVNAGWANTEGIRFAKSVFCPVDLSKVYRVAFK
jgi:TPR repeat protein/predicted Ser/Thr protein kinase